MLIKKINTGFTLIELLVVIAIIGILSSVILSSLNTSRIQAKDSSAKQSLTSIRSAMESFYSGGAGNNSYSNGCDDPDIVKLLDAAKAQTNNDAHCLVADDFASYTVYDLLNNGQYYCIDSTNFVGEIGTTLAGDGTNPGDYNDGVQCVVPTP